MVLIRFGMGVAVSLTACTVVVTGPPVPAPVSVTATTDPSGDDDDDDGSSDAGGAASSSSTSGVDADDDADASTSGETGEADTHALDTSTSTDTGEETTADPDPETGGGSSTGGTSTGASTSTSTDTSGEDSTGAPAPACDPTDPAACDAGLCLDTGDGDGPHCDGATIYTPGLVLAPQDAALRSLALGAIDLHVVTLPAGAYTITTVPQMVGFDTAPLVYCADGSLCGQGNAIKVDAPTPRIVFVAVASVDPSETGDYFLAVGYGG